MLMRIHGIETEATGGEHIDVKNPATAELIDSVPSGSEKMWLSRSKPRVQRLIPGQKRRCGNAGWSCSGQQAS